MNQNSKALNLPPGGKLRPWSLKGAAFLFLCLVCFQIVYYYNGFYAVAFVGIAAFIAFGFFTTPLFNFFLYYATSFVRGIPIPGFPLSLNQVFGLSLLVSWGFWMLRNRTLRPQGRIATVTALMAVFYGVSAITGEQFRQGAETLRYVFLYYLVAIVLASTLRGPKELQRLCWIIVVLTFVQALIGAAEVVTQRDLFIQSTATFGGRFRINGTAANSIHYGFNSIFAFPFAYYLVAESPGPARKILALLMGLFINFIALFTLNRQTFVLVAVELILAVWLLRSVFSRFLMLLIVVGALVALPFAFKIVIERFGTLGSLEADWSYRFRRDSFLLAVEMIRQHPVFGIGLGSFPTGWWPYRVDGLWAAQFRQFETLYPDFGYVQILAETGLVGLTFSLSFFIYLFRRAWRVRKEALRTENLRLLNFSGFLLTAFIVFLLANFIQDTLMYLRVWMIFGLFHLIERENFFGEEGASEPPRVEAGAT
ncbi:MAG: O-antigen ligase family protein [bacterium]